MDGQLAVLGQQRRGMIFLPHAGTARNEHDIRGGADGLQDRFGPIRHDAQIERQAAVTFDQRREHRAV